MIGLLALRLTFFPSCGTDGAGVGMGALDGEFLGDEVFCG